MKIAIIAVDWLVGSMPSKTNTMDRKIFNYNLDLMSRELGYYHTPITAGYQTLQEMKKFSEYYIQPHEDQERYICLGGVRTINKIWQDLDFCLVTLLRSTEIPDFRLSNDFQLAVLNEVTDKPYQENATHLINFKRSPIEPWMKKLICY